MKRVPINPRPDWQERLDKIGFYYHSVDGNYWQENACYVFNLAQIETLETATQTLHDMCLQACAKIVQTGDYSRLGFSPLQAELIEKSWKNKDPLLYGRFDFCYDGIQPPKLLEYNADTPTSLFEASVAQWYWLKEQQPHILPSHADQFNSIHERLLIEWKNIANHYSQAHTFDKKIAEKLGKFSPTLAEHLYNFTLHFTAVSESLEDFTTCRYLQDTAIQAGLTTEFVDIADIGWDNDSQNFIDFQNNVIKHLFKLYPWEFLTNETFSQYLTITPIQWLEPAWKLLLSNKTILAVLWEMFPNHPNLLPCYFDQEKVGKNWVRKPFFSREGANICLQYEQQLYQTSGDYGAEGFVYQTCQPLPKFVNQQGQAIFALVGSWVIGHHSAGIGMREDNSLITKDTSLFVPHLFID